MNGVDILYFVDYGNKVFLIGIKSGYCWVRVILVFRCRVVIVNYF